MAESDEAGLSWDGVSEEMARQILHQSETFMQAQMDAALAADQRAVTAASIFVAVASAVVAGTFAHWAEKGELAVLSAGLIATLCLSLGAYFCFWSARPILFYFPGNHPEQWWPCRTENLAVAIGGETENYQVRIEHNEACLAANGAAVMRGVYAAMAAPLLAAVAWGLVSIFS